MQFTKAEEYGLFGAIYLANQPANEVATLREISQAQNIPEKFLAKIFQNLTRAGLVRSHRGVRGGFSLAKPPKRITVADIIEAIQGESDAIKCVVNRRDCNKKNSCAIRELILEGRHQMFALYKKRTLLELAARYE
jgi:Rrf2 family transcriptional regulator, iron-sulfur cluster assembly transcription factor